jgi:N-acetylmuramic acid 6-phosphate etherase
MALPPDRSHVRTEHRHDDSHDLDRCDAAQCIALMLDDHRAVYAAVDRARDSLTAFIEALAPRVREGGRLVYIGAGTSGRLGVLDASECPPTFQSDPGQIVGIIAGGDAALRRSSEAMEDDPNGAAAEFDRLSLHARDTVLGIAAGGTTPFVLGGLNLARQGGAMTALLCCATPAIDRSHIDHLILLDTGPELLTGSTRLKAGSATKLALNIITTTLFVQLGKVCSNLMVDLRATNAKLTDRAIRILLEFCPDVRREDAAEVLVRADGELKTAIVMQYCDLDASTAREQLARTGGSLRDAMES